MLINKILRAAQYEIERHERIPASINRWHLVNVQHHEFTTSVTVTAGEQEFEVWVVTHLGTEETRCL